MGIVRRLQWRLPLTYGRRTGPRFSQGIVNIPDHIRKRIDPDDIMASMSRNDLGGKRQEMMVLVSHWSRSLAKMKL